MASHDPQIDPKTGLAPDEAPTPMWLPLLGAGLLLVALTYVAVKASDGREAAAGDDAAGDDGDTDEGAAEDGSAGAGASDE